MLRRTGPVVLLALAPLLLSACRVGESRPADGASADARRETQETPHVVAASPVQAGRYLVQIGGCNDCHTAGWLQKEGQVPESGWLNGSRVGFRGPWGTTYPNNLRLTVRRVSEDRWVKMLRTRDAKPPMPWFNLHAMSERDLRAIYRYIGSLGEPGDSVPDALPPGEEPSTPFYHFVPQQPGG